MAAASPPAKRSRRDSSRRRDKEFESLDAFEATEKWMNSVIATSLADSVRYYTKIDAVEVDMSYIDRGDDDDSQKDEDTEEVITPIIRVETPFGIVALVEWATDGIIGMRLTNGKSTSSWSSGIHFWEESERGVHAAFMILWGGTAEFKLFQNAIIKAVESVYNSSMVGKTALFERLHANISKIKIMPKVHVTLEAEVFGSRYQRVSKDL